MQTPSTVEAEGNTSGTSAPFAALWALFALGQAIQTNNGALHPAGITWVVSALAALWVGVIAEGRLPARHRLQTLFVPLALLMLTVQGIELASTPPGNDVSQLPWGYFTFWVVPFLVATAAAFVAEEQSAWLLRGLVVVGFAVLGAWIIRSAPDPSIDVLVWTNHSWNALLSGQNPWSISMPNPYGDTKWYAPGMADAQWVHIGYGYPPFSFLLSGIGFAFHDMRWANVGVLTLGLLAMLLLKGRPRTLAVGLLATSPRMFFVIEQAWTDAYIVGILAIFVLVHEKYPAKSGWALGPLLALKQYMIFAAPLLVLLVPRPWSWRSTIRYLGPAVISGTLLTLPFAIRDPIHMFQALTVSGHPFRADSLSLMAFTAENGVPTWPLWLQPLLLVASIAVTVRFLKPSGGNFALALALVVETFFAFSKHAFCNHHFLALGCAAVAFASGQLVTHARHTASGVTIRPQAWRRDRSRAEGDRKPVNQGGRITGRQVARAPGRIP